MLEQKYYKVLLWFREVKGHTQKNQIATERNRYAE